MNATISQPTLLAQQVLEIAKEYGAVGVGGWRGRTGQVTQAVDGELAVHGPDDSSNRGPLCIAINKDRRIVSLLCGQAVGDEEPLANIEFSFQAGALATSFYSTKKPIFNPDNSEQAAAQQQQRKDFVAKAIEDLEEARQQVVTSQREALIVVANGILDIASEHKITGILFSTFFGERASIQGVVTEDGEYHHGRSHMHGQKTEDAFVLVRQDQRINDLLDMVLPDLAYNSSFYIGKTDFAQADRVTGFQRLPIR